MPTPWVVSASVKNDLQYNLSCYGHVHFADLTYSEFISIFHIMTTLSNICVVQSSQLYPVVKGSMSSSTNAIRDVEAAFAVLTTLHSAQQ